MSRRERNDRPGVCSAVVHEFALGKGKRAMTIRVLLTAVGVVLLLANPGWAQSTATTSSSTIPTGNFDGLSTGNQKIANALFSAQKTTGTTTPLTKNQIAGLKSTEGWGRVFKTMKADGLIQSKNLGQVVSSYNHSLHASTASTASGSARTTTASATRSGRSTTHSSVRSGSRFSSAGMTNGRGFAGGSHAMGGRVASSAMGGGFGHGGMGGSFGGGGFSHGGGGGHGR
jgi:hypothetical protein